MKPSDVNRSAGNNWKLYEYMVNVTIVFQGEQPIKLAQAEIQEILMEKDFDNDHMPIFILRLMIPQTLADKIWDKDPDINVRVDSFERLQNQDVDIEKVSKRLYFNDVFKAIPTNDDPTYNTTVRKKIRTLAGYKDTEFTMEDLGGISNFVLQKKNCLYDSKTISNMILTGVNLTTAIKVLLTDAKCKNVLMSNLDNGKIFEELPILPMTFLSNIIYLEQQYGFHKDGTQVFMDFDTLYIIRMSGKATAWRRLEPKKGIFCISETSDSGNASNGGVTTPTEVLFNVDIRQYTSPTSTPVIDNTSGMNTLLMNESKATYTDVNTALGQNYNVQSTQGHNPYVENQIRLRKQEAIKVRELFCASVDLSALTPNKEYTMVSDVTALTKELSGTYRLSKVMTTFFKDGAKFTGVSHIRLKGTS